MTLASLVTGLTENFLLCHLPCWNLIKWSIAERLIKQRTNENPSTRRFFSFIDISDFVYLDTIWRYIIILFRIFFKERTIFYLRPNFSSFRPFMMVFYFRPGFSVLGVEGVWFLSRDLFSISIFHNVHNCDQSSCFLSLRYISIFKGTW